MSVSRNTALVIVTYCLALGIAAAGLSNPFPYWVPAWMWWWTGISVAFCLWGITLSIALYYGGRTGRLALGSAPIAIIFALEPISWFSGLWQW